MRADQAVRCVTAARPDYGVAACEILGARLDARSSARSLALLDIIMLRQRHGQLVNEYVHFMRQSFDDYNETCQMIDRYVAIHPLNLGLLMLRGISNSCLYGKANQCAIHAFDTDYHNCITRSLGDAPRLMRTLTSCTLTQRAFPSHSNCFDKRG
jgi:hypothetical protein